MFLRNWAPAEAEAQSLPIRPRQLLRGWRLAGLGILAAEALDAACRVDQFLLAGEEWVAGRTDFYVDVALVGRAGSEIVAARAHNPDFVIVWMNTLLWHDSFKTFPCNPFMLSGF